MKVETVNKVIAAIDKINDIAGNIAKFLLVYMGMCQVGLKALAPILCSPNVVWVMALPTATG